MKRRCHSLWKTTSSKGNITQGSPSFCIFPLLFLIFRVGQHMLPSRKTSPQGKACRALGVPPAVQGRLTAGATSASRACAWQGRQQGEEATSSVLAARSARGYWRSLLPHLHIQLQIPCCLFCSTEKVNHSPPLRQRRGYFGTKVSFALLFAPQQDRSAIYWFRPCCANTPLDPTTKINHHPLS